MATGDSVQLQSIAKPKNSPLTKRRTLEQQQQLWGWLFLSPWIIGFLAFTAFPIIFSFGLTFTDYTLANPDAARFIGLDNWLKLFSDPLARTALGVTIKFALLSTAFMCRSRDHWWAGLSWRTRWNFKDSVTLELGLLNY